MLAAIILASAITTAPTTHHITTSHHASQSRHEQHMERLHLLHIKHVAHERHQRELRLARVRPSRHVAVASYNGHTALSGTLSCNGLEALWESAGGSRSQAFIAAEIAMAESGGRQFATGLAGERGYWQIHPDHGSLSTYDPFGNARAAVIISDNGRSWSPWTTYTSGAYAGRC